VEVRAEKRYGPRMIPRYTPAEFETLWSDRTRFEIWLEVELAASEAMEEGGLVPKGTTAAIREKKLELDAEEILEIEKTTRHDVIAFLTHVEGLAGEPARWLHRGMTSSDVLDTSFAIQLVRATDALIVRTDRLIAALTARAKEHAHTPMIGRSHGIHAEPVTFGVVLAGHLAEMKRGRARLVAARAEIAVGKIAGAVGTYVHLAPEIERRALSRLGLAPETVATQVVARDRHAAFFSALAVVAASIERLATNVRHWQRTEVGEAEEKFAKGQKGSSAMPHKRNPVLSENLCGLARVVRSAVLPALENVALWHERDISHSSAERMIAPDATATLAFILDRAAQVVEGLVVYPERMKKNLDSAFGLFFSEAVMLALVGKGLPRQRAYEIVQRSAMRAFHGEGEFKKLLAADSDVSSRVAGEEFERCFDLEHALRWADEMIARAVDA
jgi:adenylosuccinate lyase